MAVSGGGRIPTRSSTGSANHLAKCVGWNVVKWREMAVEDCDESGSGNSAVAYEPRENVVS